MHSAQNLTYAWCSHLSPWKNAPLIYFPTLLQHHQICKCSSSPLALPLSSSEQRSALPPLCSQAPCWSLFPSHHFLLEPLRCVNQAPFLLLYYFQTHKSDHAIPVCLKSHGSLSLRIRFKTFSMAQKFCKMPPLHHHQISLLIESLMSLRVILSSSYEPVPLFYVNYLFFCFVSFLSL